MPVATQYLKPSLTPYLQEVLFEHVSRVTQATGLDLCVDPIEVRLFRCSEIPLIGQIYNRSINMEESQTGLASVRPRHLDGDQVLQTDATARAEYIQRKQKIAWSFPSLRCVDLQELRFVTTRLVEGLIRSTPLLPYTVRLMAREALLALRVSPGMMAGRLRLR